jgi:hypothetical protein
MKERQDCFVPLPVPFGNPHAPVRDEIERIPLLLVFEYDLPRGVPPFRELGTERGKLPVRENFGEHVVAEPFKSL